MDIAPSTGDSQEPSEPELSDAAQILLNPEGKEGDADSESDTPPAVMDEETPAPAAEGGEGESPETDPGESEPKAEFDKSMYALDVPLGDELGKKTIGELKDFYQRNQEWEQEKASYSDELDNQRYELVQARQELGQLVELVGPHATPELVERISDDRRQTIARETQMLLKAKPEWRENARYMADREALESFVSKFGISKNEFRSATDHRLILMADQARRDRQALEDARAQLEKARSARTPPKTPKSVRGKNGRFQSKAKPKLTTRDSQTAAVAELLGQAGIFKEK